MANITLDQAFVLIDAEYIALFGALSNFSDQIEQIRTSDHSGQGEDVDIHAFSEELTAALIGSAFVVCQVQISRVVKTLQDYQNDLHKRNPTKPCANKPHEIRKLGEELSIYSKVDIIWHIGNYFKHADEWPTKWETASQDAQKRTIQTIKNAGLTSSKSYIKNLYKGAEFFGEPAGEIDLMQLYWVLYRWKLKVICDSAP